MNNVPITISINKFSMYRLSPDEVVLFEFLIFKQNHFDPYGFFYHSQRKIISKLKIKRSRLEKIIKTFEDIGFLKTEVRQEGKTNSLVTYFKIDFDTLGKDEVLSQIIDEKSQLFNDFKKWLKCIF